MENILTIKDKILAFLEVRGIRKTDFFESTGIQASNFKGRNKASQPGGDMLVNILTVYPELSAEWLLRGEGNMLRTQDNEIETNPQETAVKSEPPKPSQEYIALLKAFQEQAAEIGRLQERIKQLERQKGKSASGAQTSDLAHVG